MIPKKVNTVCNYKNLCVCINKLMKIKKNNNVNVKNINKIVDVHLIIYVKLHVSK